MAGARGSEAKVRSKNCSRKAVLPPQIAGKDGMTSRSISWRAVCTLNACLGLVLAATPFAAGQDDELPEGPAKKIVQSVCVQCHEIEMVTIQNFTKDQWSHTVDLMVARGAHLTPDQIPTVVAYLASNFGKPEAGASRAPATPPASAPAPASSAVAAPPASAPPPSASTASSAAPGAPRGQDGGCGAPSLSASPQPKKRKRFWGFLKKKPKQPDCAGKETATSDNRGQ